METLERKRRDMRQREGLFLDRARQLLFTRGYHGLTMDRIAKATGYSRGTIYQHFGCKEEIIVALVTRGMKRRLTMLERAATFSGRTRERMQAIGEANDLFARMYADDARIHYVGNAGAIIQKVSEKSLYTLNTVLHRSMNVVTGVVRDAIAQGDLVLPPGAFSEEVTFNLWAMTDGGYGMSSGWIQPAELGVSDPFETVMHGCLMLCDGYGWRPLSTEWNYEATRERIRREIFPEETLKVSGL